MWDKLSQLDLVISLIGVVLTIGIFVWSQHAKITSLKKKISDMEDEEISRTGNLAFDGVLPNVEAVKAKILEIIKSSESVGKVLRIDNLGLDLETVGPMFRYTFTDGTTQKDIEYRGLIIDPDCEKMSEACQGGSNLCQTVAQGAIDQANKIVLSGASNPSIKIKSYKQLPITHGFIVDDEHLLLGFTHFENAGIVGGVTPYIYIKRDKNSKFKEGLFKSYRTWFNYLWSQGTLQVPVEKDAVSVSAIPEKVANV